MSAKDFCHLFGISDHPGLHPAALKHLRVLCSYHVGPFSHRIHDSIFLLYSKHPLHFPWLINFSFCSEKLYLEFWETIYLHCRFLSFEAFAFIEILCSCVWLCIDI